MSRNAEDAAPWCPECGPTCPLHNPDCDARELLTALRLGMSGIGSHEDPCRTPDTPCLCGVVSARQDARALVEQALAELDVLPPPPPAEPFSPWCRDCGPGYRIGGEGCRHGEYQPAEGETGVCRTCAEPIWWEVGEVGHIERVGWSDRIKRGGDSLVCFKAADYRHVPMGGREAAIYRAGFKAGGARVTPPAVTSDAKILEAASSASELTVEPTRHTPPEATTP